MLSFPYHVVLKYFLNLKSFQSNTQAKKPDHLYLSISKQLCINFIIIGIKLESLVTPNTLFSITDINNGK